MPGVDRGMPLFVLGVAVIAVEFTLMFLTSDADQLRAMGLKGLGLGTPVGIGLCILSAVVGRRKRAP